MDGEHAELPEGSSISEREPEQVPHCESSKPSEREGTVEDIQLSFRSKSDQVTRAER